eukprot:COSAG01_NODE_24_length_37608_cov_19.303154_43_plen_126_part_00
MYSTGPSSIQQPPNNPTLHHPGGVGWFSSSSSMAAPPNPNAVFKAAGGHPPAPPTASTEINLTFDDSGELGLWFGCADLCGPKTVTRVKLGSQAAKMPQLQPFFVAATGQCIPNGRLELVAVSPL